MDVYARGSLDELLLLLPRSFPHCEWTKSRMETLEPLFSTDWVSDLISTWTEMLFSLHALEQPEILEIGCFEGRMSRWLLESFPKSQLTVVDTFLGGEDQKELDLSDLRKKFERNTFSFKDRVEIYQGKSHRVLPAFIEQSKAFDFIYIDGSHQSSDVLFDACVSFHLLKPKGLMCFDDFIWAPEGVAKHLLPQTAILAFLVTHAEKMHLIGQRGRQMWVMKYA